MTFEVGDLILRLLCNGVVQLSKYPTQSLTNPSRVRVCLGVPEGCSCSYTEGSIWGLVLERAEMPVSTYVTVPVGSLGKTVL